jgi:sec-independent protein translocase protein TatA
MGEIERKFKTTLIAGGSMFGFSLGHLLIVLIIVLLFNVKKLPELGSALGKGILGFKKGIEGKSDDEKKLPKDPNDPNSRDV